MLEGKERDGSGNHAISGLLRVSWGMVRFCAWCDYTVEANGEAIGADVSFVKGGNIHVLVGILR